MQGDIPEGGRGTGLGGVTGRAFFPRLTGNCPAL